MTTVTKNSFSSVCENTEHLNWKNGKKRELLKCPIFRVNEIERTSQDGKKGNFLELKCPDWVVIIPVFRDEDGVLRFVMEAQYRHGCEYVTREFPAGIVEEGEDPETAALRELQEETGIKPKTIKFLGDINPNPAFMSNRMYVYLAEDLELVSSQNLDENEEIDVFSIPVEEAIANLGKRSWDSGAILSASALYLLDAKKEISL
ncbi:MAG: NUDIX hydrolase [Sphaerochaetaceae bacterium]|nr:NUDIX hydrolase [Sphaerochaetaceae bacterium]